MLRSRRPKLGQHFLADPRYRRRILEALDLRDRDLVIEIGAGRGAMTELLAERAQRVIAIEIDPVLARKLEEKIQNQPRIEVLQADILTCDIAEICRRNRSEQCFVFGNLPYYITSPILHRLFTFWARIRAMALLVQREVALRVTASPGTRACGYLSILAQFYSQPRVVLTVPPGVFSPPPKVRSALVEFQIRPRFPEWFQAGDAPGAGEEKKFFEFVQRCFAQKRKNLLNNLGGIYPHGRTEQELARLSLPRDARAEQLTLDQFAELYRGLEAPG